MLNRLIKGELFCFSFILFIPHVCIFDFSFSQIGTRLANICILYYAIIMESLPVSYDDYSDFPFTHAAEAILLEAYSEAKLYWQVSLEYAVFGGAESIPAWLLIKNSSNAI